MNKLAFSAAVAFAVLMMPMAAAESQNSQASPGMVGPDSPLYGLETAWDNAAVGIGLKKASSVAKERAAEAEAMAEKNNTKGMQKAAEQFGMVAEKAFQNNETGLESSIRKIEELAEKAPNEQAREGMETALRNMREARRKSNRSMRYGFDQIPNRPHSGPDAKDETMESPETDEETATPDQNTGDTEQTSPDKAADTTSGTGRFDLLVSDRPADISSFDYLNVSFDRARIFPEKMESNNETDNESSTNETEDDMNETETNMTEDMDTNGTENETSTNETEEKMTDKETEETDQEGFREIEINDSTVDLTRVVGENAQSIANTELEAGTYDKIELYSSEIDASVNGSNVDVKIPPGKLMITKPFTILENNTTEFVFDIQVVLRGNQQNNQGYILKPVISESGVAGKDVEMERGTSEKPYDNSTEEQGPPDNPGNQGNQGGPRNAGGP